MLVTAARFLVTGQYYITELYPVSRFSSDFYGNIDHILELVFFALIFQQVVSGEEFSGKDY
jgi:hypothetical protein